MYREVTMFEVKEALRLWLSGTPKKRIAAQLGLDPKTVRHYVTVGAGIGLQLGTVLTERSTSGMSCWRSSRAEAVREATPGASA